MTLAPRKPATVRNTTTTTITTSPSAVKGVTTTVGSGVGECVDATGDKKAFGGDDENVVLLQNSDTTRTCEDDDDNDDNNHPNACEEHHRVMIQEEPLKYARDSPTLLEEDTAAASPVLDNRKRRKRPFGNNDKQKHRRRRHCEFNETVQVVPIPMRTEYSSHVRQRLWSNSLEIQQNAARNTLEFASEGWNWRSVILDESMYICDKTGELIHPIHYEPYSLVEALDGDQPETSSSSDSVATTAMEGSSSPETDADVAVASTTEITPTSSSSAELLPPLSANDTTASS